jgi:cytochrome o ubiquinol oxidase operon protein cyoD
MSNLANKNPGRKKLVSYITGFVISIILILAAFGLVEKQAYSEQVLYIAVGALALVQALVQVYCFIRSNTSQEDGTWNILAIMFSGFVIMILVGGSLWIMYNLNYNMVN